MRKHFALGFLSLAASQSVQGQTFSDATFNNADWTDVVLQNDTTDSNGTVIAAAQLNGVALGSGPPNPLSTTPPYRVSAHWNWGINGAIRFAHYNINANTELTGGANNNISFSADVSHLTDNGISAIGYVPLILQDGLYYVATSSPDPSTNPSTSVVNLAWTLANPANNLTSNDFTLVVGQVGQPNPDFTCGALPMRFGYLSSNTRASDQIMGEFAQTSLGVDNWNVNIVRDSCQTFSYPIKFVCGRVTDDMNPVTTLAEGVYRTDINILNSSGFSANIQKIFTPIVNQGMPIGREPNQVSASGSDQIQLASDNATMDDCARIYSLVYGDETPKPETVGYLQLVSDREIDVTVVYTYRNLEDRGTSIDVERIQGRLEE